MRGDVVWERVGVHFCGGGRSVEDVSRMFFGLQFLCPLVVGGSMSVSLIPSVSRLWCFCGSILSRGVRGGHPGVVIFGLGIAW